MKKIILAVICIGILFNVSAQKKEKLKGNKVITDVFNTLKGFNAVEIGDNLTVSISQTGSTGYHLFADENLISDVNIQVVDSVLKISTTSNITSSKKLEINLTVAGLEKITLREDAKLEGQGRLNLPSLTMVAYDDAKFKLELNANNSYFRMTKGVKGELILSGDKSVMMFDDKSSVKGEVHLKELEIKMNDKSDLELLGDVTDLKFVGASNTSLKGKDLRTTTTDLNLSDGSNAHVDTNKMLTINARDNSSVYVYGQPEIKIEGFNDKAQIIKR
ncbi:MAG: DUF2807 domain-containing protein [Lutibacter sp.]|nr:DUF2807 domain-containing protein [Lutibacter sp.]